jgi:hypothetical protein
LQKFEEETWDHYWVLNFPSRSRASRQPHRFLPSRRSREKVAAKPKPQSQPPGNNSTAETSKYNTMYKITGNIILK